MKHGKGLQNCIELIISQYSLNFNYSLAIKHKYQWNNINNKSYVHTLITRFTLI
jgi:hypothetical protein